MITSTQNYCKKWTEPLLFVLLSNDLAEYVDMYCACIYTQIIHLINVNIHVNGVRSEKSKYWGMLLERTFFLRAASTWTYSLESLLAWEPFESRILCRWNWLKSFKDLFINKCLWIAGNWTYILNRSQEMLIQIYIEKKVSRNKMYAFTSSLFPSQCHYKIIDMISLTVHIRMMRTAYQRAAEGRDEVATYG